MEGGWIGPVLGDRDERRHDVDRMPQGSAQEALGRGFVPLGGAHNIESLSGGIHRLIEIAVFSLLLTVGLVRSIGALGEWENRPTTRG